MHARSSTVRLVLALTFATIAALGVLAVNDSWLLPGATADSVAYVEAAQSLARDGALHTRVASWAAADSLAVLRHYPPGLPVLLAAGIRSGLRPHVAVLWAIAAGAALSVAVAVWIATSIAGPFAGALAGALLLLHPVFVQIHLAPWTEPLYVAILLAQLWMMAQHPRASWAHGILAGLGLSVRYVGVASVGLAGAWALARTRAVPDRVRAFLAATLPSAVAAAAWLWLPDASAPIRAHAYYPGLLREIGHVPSVLMRWFGGALGPAGSLLALAASAALLVLGLRQAWRTGGTPSNLARASVGYGILHVVVVCAARAWADGAIPLDSRILYPVLIVATLWVVVGAAEALRRARPIVGAAILIGLGGWALAAAAEVEDGVPVAQAQGRFYSDVGWLADPAIRWIDNGSWPWETVYSNEPGLIVFHSDRAARLLPTRDEDLAAFVEAYRKRPGPLLVALPLHEGDLSASFWLHCLSLEIVASSRRAAVLVPQAAEGPSEALKPRSTWPGRTASPLCR